MEVAASATGWRVQENDYKECEHTVRGCHYGYRKVLARAREGSPKRSQWPPARQIIGNGWMNVIQTWEFPEQRDMELQNQ